MNKRLFLWALYDFANSIVLIAFLFYFSQWLVIDQGKPAWWYNITLVISSMLFIITAPIVSKKIDIKKVKIVGLRFWSGITFVGYFVLSIITMLTDSMDVLATILFTLATYTYLVCFLYFTPMLNDLSNDGDRSLKSGIGQGANSIGQVAGILITLPFVNGITLFGEPGRAQALLPATIIFGLLSLPMLIFYKENSNTLLNNQNSKQSSESVSIVSLFKEVFGHKRLALFLVAYFLFSDAMLTFANNFPLYLETVHNVSDNIKSILTASILILATIGAIVFGKIADKKGNIKTLNIILIIYCFIFVIMAFVKNFQLLIPVFLFAGILFGPVWGISRALVGELAPSHLVASSYSYYVVAERFATFVGPMVWSIALIIMGDGIVGYQTGLLSLMALLVFGIFILNKIRNPLNP